MTLRDEIAAAIRNVDLSFYSYVHPHAEIDGSEKLADAAIAVFKAQQRHRLKQEMSYEEAQEEVEK